MLPSSERMMCDTSWAPYGCGNECVYFCAKTDYSKCAARCEEHSWNGKPPMSDWVTISKEEYICLYVLNK